MRQSVTFQVKQIKDILGGDISTKNSKMPGATFGLSTSGCNVGSKLRDVCGSVCERCYAAKLEKLRPTVKQGWQNRTNAVQAAMANPEESAKWVMAMAQRIDQVTAKTGELFFRWHDSGDLLSAEHLEMIVAVCDLTPHVNHWLPTKEKALVNAYLKANPEGFPINLSVRVSAAMVGAEPLKSIYVGSSTVHRKGSQVFGYECPAYKQGGNCGDCRACWNQNVKNISYPLH